LIIGGPYYKLCSVHSTTLTFNTQVGQTLWNSVRQILIKFNIWACKDKQSVQNIYCWRKKKAVVNGPKTKEQATNCSYF